MEHRADERYTMIMLRIAFLQIVPTGSLDGNLEKGIMMCRRAREFSADIALFPEMWSNGYDIYSRPADEWKKNAISSDSSFIQSFRSLSAELGMAIAITLLERGNDNPRNSMILFDRYGDERLHYSKVHTCDFGEERNLEPGDVFHVADLDTVAGNVRIGAMICYDREFPESARILMLKGAEVILVPNACPMEINRLSQLRGRAYENMVAIATCNYPSPHPDCNGHSTLFDGVVYMPGISGSRDTCVFEAGCEEGIYVATLDVDMLREYRQREVWGKVNRRPELYGIMAEEER